MRIRSIKYYFIEAFLGVVRNSLMSVTSVLTVFSCMTILIFSYCIAANVDYNLEQLANKTGISIFIEDDCSDAKVEELHKKIQSLSGVAEVRFITKDAALESMSGVVLDKNRADFIQGLEDNNPLPRSFEVSLSDAREQDTILNELESLIGDGVYKINDQRSITNMLLAFNNLVRYISMVIILMLSFLSVVIIMNTIKLTVNTRKADINIMKYVGATDWFIKWPFIIEGVIIGILGAVLPVVMLYFAYDGLIILIKENVGTIARLFVFRTGIELFSTLFPIAVAFGIVLGVLGSTISMRKFLKV